MDDLQEINALFLSQIAHPKDSLKSSFKAPQGGLRDTFCGKTVQVKVLEQVVKPRLGLLLISALFWFNIFGSRGVQETAGSDT